MGLDSMWFIVMIAVLAFILFTNFKMIKRYKNNKKYISCYQDIFHEAEGAYANLKEYMETEKNPCFVEKARIIRLYHELNNKYDYSESIEKLDIKKIFTRKGVVNNEEISINSDSFIFIILDMAKAYKTGEYKVIDELLNKFDAKDYDYRLEYQELKALDDALNKRGDKGNTFFKSLLNGEYTNYVYDKNMIGLFKRIAAALLDYNVEEFDEFFKQDLSKFAETLIGKSIMSDIGIYDKYKVLENKTEENKEEVKEENKE